MREAKKVIRRTLAVALCPVFDGCGGTGLTNMQKARPTTCKRCHGTGIVSTLKQGQP